MCTIILLKELNMYLCLAENILFIYMVPCQYVKIQSSKV